MSSVKTKIITNAAELGEDFWMFDGYNDAFIAGFENYPSDVYQTYQVDEAILVLLPKQHIITAYVDMDWVDALELNEQKIRNRLRRLIREASKTHSYLIVHDADPGSHEDWLAAGFYLVEKPDASILATEPDRSSEVLDSPGSEIRWHDRVVYARNIDPNAVYVALKDAELLWPAARPYATPL